MKRLVLIALLFTTSFAARAQVVHDADAEVRKVDGSFTAIDISNAFTLYISQGSEQAVAISATEQNIKDRIKTEVRNGVLRITLDNSGWTKFNLNDKKIKAYVTVTDLTRIEASGACNIRIVGQLKSNNLKLELSGASDLKGEINATELKLEASGASRINISGTAKTARMELNGASGFKGFDFEADNCDLEVSGTSNVEITVNKELEAEASGVSHIKYKGSASVTKLEASGLSSIKKKD